jgi:hypothetical protein
MNNGCSVSDTPDRFVWCYEGLTACYLYQFFISLRLFDVGVTGYGVGTCTTTCGHSVIEMAWVLAWRLGISVNGFTSHFLFSPST